jgi:predicted phage baseplate assembly protein
MDRARRSRRGDVDRSRLFTSEDDTGDATVTFGNGVHGRRLPTGTANVKATYRFGMGSAGNVAAGQISQLATQPLGVQGVINPLPATGGADADPIDQERANAPMAVMALDRLVSVQDYADFTRTYAGIGKAVSARLSDGRKQFVHVTIAGAEDIQIDTNSDLYANLLQSLRSYGDPYLPVEVDICRVRLIVMAAAIGLQPDYVWDDVVPNVTAAIQALFAFDARALGQTAYLSEATAAAQQVEGVAWVNVKTFDGVPQSITAGQLAALAATLSLRPYIPAALAEVNAKAEPGSTNRILPAELVFMTSDIPETLILAQG